MQYPCNSLALFTSTIQLTQTKIHAHVKCLYVCWLYSLRVHFFLLLLLLLLVCSIRFFSSISSSFLFCSGYSLSFLHCWMNCSVSFTLNTTPQSQLQMPTQKSIVCTMFSLHFLSVHIMPAHTKIFPLQVAIPFCALIDVAFVPLFFRFRYFIYEN